MYFLKRRALYRLLCLFSMRRSSAVSVVLMLSVVTAVACRKPDPQQPTVQNRPPNQPQQPAPAPTVGGAWTPWGALLPGWTFPAPPAGGWPALPWPFPGTAGFPTIPGLPGLPGTTPGNPTNPNPNPSPTPNPIPGDPNWPAAWATLEEQVLLEVNARRASGSNCGGRPFSPAIALQGHPALRNAARGHSKDMASRNYFDHNSPEGRSMVDRIRAAGFTNKTTLGENIAAGNSTARETVQQWMDSPGHCMNIMNPDFRYLGVGYFYQSGTQYGHYWTQNFAGG